MTSELDPRAARRRRGLSIGGFTITLSLAMACGGGGNVGTTSPPPPPPPTGSFSLSVTGAPLTMARSTSGSVTIQVSRTGSFSADVNLAATGLPAGVTPSFNAATVVAGAPSSTLTLMAGTTAAAGTSTITVTGTATGATTQSVTFTLTVTAPPAQTGPFTLSISATSFLVYPSNQLATNPIITITRNAGFTGPVSFTVTGLPLTLFLGFTPSTTTGNTSTALVLGTGATPNGAYTATIRGASAQGDQTITLQVVVAPPSTGNIRWKWCSASLPRYFFAVKDGNGPWTRIMPANDTSYSFSISSGVGQVAEITNDSGGFRTTIYQYTAQEMAARAASQCGLVPHVTPRTASGSFGGVTGFRTSQVGMGWWFGSANGNGSFTMQNLPPGALDVVAVRNGDIVVPSTIPVDRMIIRRGVNPASGASLPVLDFTAAESFAPTTATWTFGNVNAESFSVSQSIMTAGGTTGIFTSLPAIDGTATSRPVYGVPTAQTVAGDLHQVIATVATTGPSPSSPMRASRQIVAYARTLGDRALTFGPAMPPGTVSPIAATPAGRLRAQGTVPAEYNSGVWFDVTQTSTARFLTIIASRGFLGAGNAYDLQMPDLTGAIGWDTQFPIRAGIATNWWVSGGGVLDWFDARNVYNSTKSRWTGVLTGVTAPSDGATYYMARTFGTATP